LLFKKTFLRQGIIEDLTETCIEDNNLSKLCQGFISEVEIGFLFVF